ncbi:MAG: YceI family protein [Bacteroidales bacterium]|jgi:polyisoprenoid-binding protein YceI|nr:YceI family protein [Bacteroidales bacterium]
MKTTRNKSFLLVGILAMSTWVSAQVLTFSPQNSSIVINGTSNVHDWKSKTSQIKGQMVFADNNQLKSLSVDIPVKSIKSGEKLMDSKTYDTLGAEKNPTISFRMTDVAGFQRNGNDISVAVNGNLTIAGTTKKVVLKAKGKSNQNGVYTFNGETQIKMSDFGMKPPTVLMGTLKVGDLVKLSFDVSLTENQKASVN